MRFEYFIGFRYLTSRKKSGFLSVISLISVLGVSVGVMALIIVLSAVSGFQSDFRKRILGNNAPLILFSVQDDISDVEQVLATIDAVPGVKGSSPFVYGEVLSVSDIGRSAGCVVYGVDPNRVGGVTSLSEDMVEGELSHLDPTSDDLPGIILGKDLAEKQLFVSVGSSVSLVSPKGELSPYGFGPKMRKFRVVGLFKTGLLEYDAKSAYIHLQMGQSFFDEPGKVRGIQVSVNNIDRARPVGAALHRALDGRFYVRHWMELNADLFNAFKLEKTVFFIVVAMIVLVASFNIISTLTLLVLTKTKEIAILKAMGAADFSISRIFMFVGTSIGAMGTLLGIVLGLIGCLILAHYVPFPLDANVYQIDHLPIRIDPWEVLIVAISAVLISFGSTLYPAQQAARIEPAEGIRND